MNSARRIAAAILAAALRAGSAVWARTSAPAQAFKDTTWPTGRPSVAVPDAEHLVPPSTAGRDSVAVAIRRCGRGRRCPVTPCRPIS